MKIPPPKIGLSDRFAYRRMLLTIVGLLGSYPLFVFGAVYWQWFHAEFPGGRNGPSDAYRHALASAIVAYTGSPSWVEWVTHIMERDGLGNAARAMDAHNNRLGARIGSQAISWEQMQVKVRLAVKSGDVDVRDANKATWLPANTWQERLY